MADVTAPATESAAPSTSGADEEKAAEAPAKDATPSTSTEKGENADKDAAAGADAPIEIIDVDDTDTKTTTPAAVAPQPAQHPQAAPPPMIPIAYRAFNLDVSFEASKLPLDVAIFNSARAAGGDEKIRKYLQAVLVVGGTALVPGMAHALESRYVPVSFSAFPFLGPMPRATDGSSADALF